MATASMSAEYRSPPGGSCSGSACVLSGESDGYLEPCKGFCESIFEAPPKSRPPKKTDAHNALIKELDMETVRAEELRHHSYQERQLAHEELHGFARTALEIETKTPELVETSLALLPMELNRISKPRKRAYQKAVFLKPSLATDRAFLLMFLRATLFDVPSAAQRICRFFQEKLDLFGEDKLVKKITLDDLTQDDIDSVCTSGAGLFLPKRDRSGRLIFLTDYQYIDYRHWMNVNRMVHYMAMAEVEEDESVQTKGIVEVFFFTGPLKRQQLITEHVTKGLRGLMCLPVRLVGIHFCYNNAALKPIMNLAQMAFGASNRLRLRPHCGSILEIMYELMSFGIHIPKAMLDENEKDKKDLVDTYLLKRSQIEHNATPHEAKQSEFQNGMVNSPSSFHDVLLGKGKPFQNYSGNLRMNELVDGHLEQYRHSKSKTEKTEIATEIVAQIHCSGGRFLERKEDHWKIVSDETVLRNKVTQAFRVRNRPAVKKLATDDGVSCRDMMILEEILQDEEEVTAKRVRRMH